VIEGGKPTSLNTEHRRLFQYQDCRRKMHKCAGKTAENSLCKFISFLLIFYMKPFRDFSYYHVHGKSIYTAVSENQK